MTEVIDSASLRRDLMEAASNLRAAIDRAREASIEYVGIKHDYERAFAQAFIDAEGSAPLRKQISNASILPLVASRPAVSVWPSARYRPRRIAGWKESSDSSPTGTSVWGSALAPTRSKAVAGPFSPGARRG